MQRATIGRSTIAVTEALLEEEEEEEEING